MNKYNTNLILHATDTDEARRQLNTLFKVLQLYNKNNPDNIIKFDFKRKNDQPKELDFFKEEK